MFRPRAPREQLEELDRAYLAYLQALKDTHISPCPSVWPSDPPGPNYVGTRCDLIDGHLDDPDSPEPRHRHRIAGTTTDVTW